MMANNWIEKIDISLLDCNIVSLVSTCQTRWHETADRHLDRYKFKRYAGLLYRPTRSLRKQKIINKKIKPNKPNRWWYTREKIAIQNGRSNWIVNAMDGSLVRELLLLLLYRKSQFRRVPVCRLSSLCTTLGDRQRGLLSIRRSRSINNRPKRSYQRVGSS